MFSEINEKLKIKIFIYKIKLLKKWIYRNVTQIKNNTKVHVNHKH